MSDIKQQIADKLAKVEHDEHVKVLYAVESGSRAWGVESPDSDYDVRFIYIRKRKEYLRLQEKRDVMECQLDEVLDINGWDLKKALIQFHKGNATLFEWANSPIVYKEAQGWREVYESCKPYFSIKAALHHYYGTARSTFCQYLQGDEVPYKKYIYALRPLLACKYIEDSHGVAPVRFDELLRQELPKDLRTEIEWMLQVKAKSCEADRNPRLPLLHRYIETEIRRYGRVAKEMADDRTLGWEALDAAFLKAVEW